MKVVSFTIINIAALVMVNNARVYSSWDGPVNSGTEHFIRLVRIRVSVSIGRLFASAKCSQTALICGVTTVIFSLWIFIRPSVKKLFGNPWRET